MTEVNNNLIFDVGMHNGRDTKFYLDKGFNVVAIEASPYLCDEARKTFEKEIETRKLKIYNKAIAKERGNITFRRYKDHDDWSSIVPDWNTTMYKHEYEECIVESTSLDTIIETEGIPYYLKIDIEGSDIYCLYALKEIVFLPKFVSVELMSINNFENNSKIDFLEILCALRSLGYTKFQIVDQSLHSKTVCPNPSLEGKYVDAQFDGYSSGLFGKELPENWKTIDEVTFDYLTYLGYRQKAEIENQFTGFKKRVSKFIFKPKINVMSPLPENAWFDIHATY